LHPNAGSRLSNDILLLPKDSSSCTSGDACFDDHMPLPFVPVVANHTQEHNPQTCPEESHSDTEDSSDNFSQNDEDLTSNEANSDLAQNDEPGSIQWMCFSKEI
jgi:hypothetical protein